MNMKPFFYIAKNKKDVLKLFKKEFGIAPRSRPKVEIKKLTLIPNKLHNMSHGNNTRVVLNNEIIFEWNNDANINYPEDLTWSRHISGVYAAGVSAGSLLEKNKNKWNPVSNAPKNGTNILGYHAPSGAIAVVAYYNGSWIDDTSRIVEPTHWMDLPNLPD